MMFLPASLMTLMVLHVSAVPIDRITCDPTRLSLILNPSWATSPTIHAYCSSLFAPSRADRPVVPSLEVSINATPTDIHKACECIVAMPEAPPTIEETTSHTASRQQQMHAQAVQQQQQRFQQVTEQQELRIRSGLPPSRRQPYGRGAVPVPIGSELKGFGARDTAYRRGSHIDGARNRAD